MGRIQSLPVLAFQSVLGRTAALCRVFSALVLPGKPRQLSCSPTHGQGLGVLYFQLGVGVYRYRLSVGTNEKIQLSSLIAAFQVTRDLIVSEA